MRLSGIGLYTFQEASRLTGIPNAELRRWLLGYRSGGGDDAREHEPLWTPEPKHVGIDGLSFHDLLEVRFVKHFRRLGLSLQTIRVAAKSAHELFQSPYPFTCLGFKSDGKAIFADVIADSGDPELLDLKRRQYVINNVIRPSLFEGIEFSGETAARWYPLERNKAVVLDPNFAFGKPIVTSGGVRTDILYDAWLAEDRNKNQVASLYEVSLRSVSAAIRFEQRLAA